MILPIPWQFVIQCVPTKTISNLSPHSSVPSDELPPLLAPAAVSEAALV